MLESLACAVPVIASDSPGVRCLLADGEDGLLAKAGDPDDLAAKLGQVLGDEPLRQAMGLHGRGKVETNFGWRRGASRLEAIYSELLRAPAQAVEAL